MRYAIYSQTTGQILRIITGSQSLIEANCGNSESFLEFEIEGDDSTHYVEGGVLVAIPPKPSEPAEWDPITKTWVAVEINLEPVKKALNSQIEKLREQKIAAVIVYDGANVDADALSQRNISNKIAELSARISVSEPSPIELLVWRDADNGMHSFADDAEMLAWLNGLVIAIATRGTLAYAWSWQKKAEVVAATTLAELEAIDLS